MELLKIVLTTTYFSFRGDIYKQKFEAAMGSPCSAIIANIFMEWLEQRAIADAPAECMRYVDDILEIIPRGSTQALTDHLNQADPTNIINFTHEEQAEGKIPFLDTLICRKEDGSVKLQVYRKKTHTDQYLNFTSQHPLRQKKLGVIRTLLDRKEAIITEEADKQEEEDKIKNALSQCGYPKWALEKVKKQMTEKIKNKGRKKENRKEKSNGMVVVPYIQGVSKRLQRVYKKYSIQQHWEHAWSSGKVQDSWSLDHQNIVSSRPTTASVFVSLGKILNLNLLRWPERIWYCRLWGTLQSKCW